MTVLYCLYIIEKCFTLGEVLRARKFYNQVKEVKIKLLVYNINKKFVKIIYVKLSISTEPYQIQI
ncbi:hypothetical protein SDC9_160820 [bioreactor metagenome]|uniref:Uncharacterized protein n=1 Tax=bioreactor metagenome TaxID=1076179 RepID=A0A645FJI5_9ZZZZ